MFHNYYLQDNHLFQKIIVLVFNRESLGSQWWVFHVPGMELAVIRMWNTYLLNDWLKS